jgi:hypothetical protein
MTAVTPAARGSRHRDAVIARAARSSLGAVMPADWRERRALRRLTEQGIATPLVGYPDVWLVIR